jgi:hypothetical protein
MTRTRILRSLRIAFSTGCGIVCLLLIVLWVRSYWKDDGIALIRSNRLTILGSVHGTLYCYSHPPMRAPYTDTGWRFGSSQPRSVPTFLFESQLNPKDTRIRLPHWYVAPIIGALAFVPWIHWSRRFSLRTLLLAMFLVAAMFAALTLALR